MQYVKTGSKAMVYLKMKSYRDQLKNGGDKLVDDGTAKEEIED